MTKGGGREQGRPILARHGAAHGVTHANYDELIKGVEILVTPAGGTIQHPRFKLGAPAGENSFQEEVFSGGNRQRSVSCFLGPTSLSLAGTDWSSQPACLPASPALQPAYYLRDPSDGPVALCPSRPPGGRKELHPRVRPCVSKTKAVLFGGKADREESKKKRPVFLFPNLIFRYLIILFLLQ